MLSSKRKAAAMWACSLGLWLSKMVWPVCSGLRISRVSHALFLGPLWLRSVQERTQILGQHLPEGATAPQRIGLVGYLATVNGLPMQPSRWIVMYLCLRGVCWDLMEIWAPKPRDLGVHIGVDAAGKQGIVGKVDAWNYMRSTERHLLRLGRSYRGYGSRPCGLSGAREPVPRG